MSAESAPPSTLRRFILALASLGLDLRPQVNRVRNFILRPIRHEIGVKLDELTCAQGEIRTGIADLQRELHELKASQVQILHSIEALRQAQDPSAVDLERMINAERNERRLRIALLERLVSAGPEPAKARPGSSDLDEQQPEVSVILPTYNRAGFIADAIESVQAQLFADWELIVVDDGSSDDTEAVVAPYLADPRIRLVRQPNLGSSAARNHGMRLARGQLIAHIDSDNLWFPGFLWEAARAMRANPDVGIVYGVLVSDSHSLGERCLLFSPFDRALLLQGNFIDLNTVVHRRSLFEDLGGFDETLSRLLDWELLLRYTAEAPALGLPVLAARYRVCDGHRISDTVPGGPSWVAVRRKWHAPVARQRKPRVLYVAWHYPQLSETYLEGEIRCMRRWGADVHVWRTVTAASPYPTTVPIHDGSLADAVRLVKPDVIHIHWLSFALTQDDELAALGVPVTIRMHGFDVTAESLRTVLEKPWLRAVYAFPRQVELLHPADSRLKSIPVAFETALFRPSQQKDRRLVVRTGASLPSKDIALFFQLANLLPDYRFVFAGVTCNEAEYYVETLQRLRAELHSPVELHFDLPRDAVAELVAQAAIYVHTIHPPESEFGSPIGMPISIAEAMATGAYVLNRDLPELVEYVGNAGATYRDVEHAAELIAATAAWSEEQWRQAWTRSVDRAYMHHADEIVLRPIFEDWCGMVRSAH